MVLLWKSFIIIIVVISDGEAFTKNKQANVGDWRVVEKLAEENPFVIALLNKTQQFICTGTIINKRTVLTSGSCLAHDPRYIAVGAVVLGKGIHNPNSVFKLASTKLHEDYLYNLNGAEPNSSHINNNIALLHVVDPGVDVFQDIADVGNYYACELKEKYLTVVGFGRLNNFDVTVLQKQTYKQTPCANPKWYYCVCGFEYSTYEDTYEQEFGEGAPVLFNTEVVALAAAPCGTLYLPEVSIKYNIFTVIGPYMKWIGKSKPPAPSDTQFRTMSSDVDVQRIISLKYICILLVIIKLFR